MSGALRALAADLLVRAYLSQITVDSCAKRGSWASRWGPGPERRNGHR